MMPPDHDHEEQTSALDDLRHTARAVRLLAGFALNDALGHGWQAPDEDEDGAWQPPDNGLTEDDATPEEG